MQYLSENPPNYVNTDAIDQYEASLATQSQSRQPPQQRTQLPKVDIALANSLLSLALDTDLTQNAVMNTLATQTQQIRRVGDTIDTIDGNMQRVDHLLRGIESYRYYMFGV